MTVPEVLLNGNHAEIEKWRYEKALEKTRKNRPDLLTGEYGDM
jgi:tRNA (guanine37-N1)-methyltransferase